MQTIKTFGDSFLYGSDLADDPTDVKTVNERVKEVGRKGAFSKLTWPALVADQLKVNYHSHAMGGVSNSYIARKTIQYASADALNVIQWTWIDRSEYYNIIQKDWQTIRPSSTDSKSTQWYKQYHSELQDKWQSLMLITSVLRYLEESAMPYVCHVLDHLLLDQEYYVPAYITKLQEYLKPRVTWFPDNRTFFEWAKMEKFPISDNWHPLEQAHEEAAKIMHPEYERYCK